MKFADWLDTNSLAVKQSGKWVCLVSNNLDISEDGAVATWVFLVHWFDSDWDILDNLLQGGLFFFNTEEECYDFYKVFEQPLIDSSAIYACTFNPNGLCETENT